MVNETAADDAVEARADDTDAEGDVSVTEHSIDGGDTTGSEELTVARCVDQKLSDCELQVLGKIAL